ncbi:steryl ester hydrolase, putative [Plasmodium ovale]|uniref:Steryl ester hydrolase, putative n=2 Tax=Plasmodium ovale TaxID=36330 RepID=A0A1A8WE40_PLAOA|nr:steryl ester hydrolase, putative [Plasmodium ovale curtisi]SCP04594.1 steryl ester hydrolase, putative [Plasmodium ovale]
MSRFALSNLSPGINTIYPAFRELNTLQSNLLFLNADTNEKNNNNNNNNNNNCDSNSRCSSGNDDSHVEEEENTRLSEFCGKKKKKYKFDDMEKLLHKLTNGKFKAEKHYVYTIDGYRLNLYRIVNTENPEANNIKNKRGVFCLNHGLFESSINYACKGYNSLAFKIFSNNYDVWISNNRGNSFTKFVGKKYAMKKIMERYSLEDLKDLGFDSNNVEGQNSEEEDTHNSILDKKQGCAEGVNQSGVDNHSNGFVSGRGQFCADSSSCNNALCDKTADTVEENTSNTFSNNEAISTHDNISQNGNKVSKRKTHVSSSKNDNEGKHDSDNIYKRGNGSLVGEVKIGPVLGDTIINSVSNDASSSSGANQFKCSSSPLPCLKEKYITKKEAAEKEEKGSSDSSQGTAVNTSSVHPDVRVIEGSSTHISSDMNSEKMKYHHHDVQGEASILTGEVGNEEEVEELQRIGGLSGVHEDDKDEEDVIPDEDEIDDWTFEDMGSKDLPAIIKYIRTETEREKIIYVGFSQGSIQMLISSCINPYVNNSIKRCYLLSLPIILRSRYNLLKSVKFLLHISKYYKAILGGRALIQKVLPDKLASYLISNSADLITRHLFKYYNENIDSKEKEIYFLHTPSGTTSKANLKKWISSFDNNPVTDIIEKYAHKCSIPMTLIFGDKDTIVHTQNSINYMQKKFSKNDLKIIRKEDWSHLDPVWSDNDKIVISCILNDMKEDDDP